MDNNTKKGSLSRRTFPDLWVPIAKVKPGWTDVILVPECQRTADFSVKPSVLIKGIQEKMPILRRRAPQTIAETVKSTRLSKS